MIAMRRVCWELNDDDHDHPLYAVPRTHDLMIHCGYCHHGGDRQ